MTAATLTSPLEQALAYAAAGWRVVPIGQGQKHPDLPAWQDAATTDPATITRWYLERPGRGVGVATGDASGVFVLDVDIAEGKAGDETLAELERTYGTLPDTSEVITGSGGRHLYFRHPEGLDLTNSAGKLGPGLDIRANGGQVLAPPTVHPLTGRAYEWDAACHPVVDPPGWLLALLAEPERTHNDSDNVGPRPRFEQAVTARDRFNLNPQADVEVARMLVAAGWAEGRPDKDGVRYFTRPGKRLGEGHGATLNGVAPGVLNVFTDGDPRFQANRTYDPFDVLRLLVHGGDQTATDAQLVELGWGQSAGSQGLHILGQATPAPGTPLHLPDSFWEARPALAHIRQAARSRLVAPDAVLGTVLTRVTACTPHFVELPAIVGKAMGLSFYVAAVGPPSAGKSAAAGVAAELVPAPTGVVERNVGSGEGFIELLFEMVDEPDPDTGKKVKVKRQTRYNAIFTIDEGEVLADLGARSGSTLMPTLRSAYTHGTLGQANASAERNRHLAGDAYVYGVTMGIQPEKAGPLLSDAAGGTPQRFLWLMATDPDMPDHDIDWPGPLDWEPIPSSIDSTTVTGPGRRRRQVDVAPAVRQEVRALRRQAVRGGVSDDHRTLVRLKTAAALGVLDGRTELTDGDWALAEQLVAVSEAVKASVADSLATVGVREVEKAGRKQGHRDAIAEETAESRRLRSAAKSVANRVTNHHAEHPEPGCTASCLTKAMSGRQRAAFEVDDVVAEAVRLEWITTVGGRFMPGSSTPS